MTGKPVRTLEGPHDRVLNLAFAHRHNWVASGHIDGTIRVWDLTTGNVRWATDEKVPLRRGTLGASVLRFSPDDRLLLFTGLARGALLLDAATGKVLHKYDTAGPLDVNAGAVFSADGKHVALIEGIAGRRVVLWDTATGKVVRSWFGEPREQMQQVLAMSPDGRLLATAKGSYESTVKVWDVAKGQEVMRFEGQHGGVYSLTFSRDGRTLASGAGDASVVLWDVTARQGNAGVPLPPKRLQELWDTLADEDAAKLHAVSWELALSADGAVPFLRGKLRPVKAADAVAVDRWVRQLDADEFEPRQKAVRELEARGASAIPRLRDALEAKPSLEVQKRIEAVIAGYLRSTEWTTQRQAVAVLERGGSVAARKLVDELARGAERAPLSEEARLVGERWKR